MKFSSVLTIGLLISVLIALTTAVQLDDFGPTIDTEIHCDDCSSGNVIPSGYSFVYFGETYYSMYVSANGMISLGETASDLESFDGVPIIAPYLFDLDTELTNNDEVDGTVFYRTELAPDPEFDQFVHDYFGINFYTNFEVIVTYDRVRMEGDTVTAERNTFQAVIYNSAYGDTAVCFNYPPNGLNWPDQTSTAFPTVGFFSGADLHIAYYLPGSGSAQAANLDSIPGNFGVQGQFCYLTSGLEIADACLITTLSCRPPAFFPINTILTIDNVLATYTKCDAQEIQLSAISFSCDDVGQLIAVTATIGSDSCVAYFIPTVNTALAYLNCPADVTVYSSDSTTVHWDPPTPIGECYSHQSIGYTPDSSLFPVGTTTVTYYAYDNQYHSVSCSFDVTVALPVTITYEVVDILNRPIASATISAYPDCAPTDQYGRCSVVAPYYFVGDTIPAGNFYITYGGNIYVIPHSTIYIDCVNTLITIILSPPGWYRTASGDIIACSAGTYSNTYEAGYCISCPPGYYTDDLYANECELCPLGYSSGEGAVECYSCTAGYFLNTDSLLCEICPAGTYSCDRAILCEACPEGSWSNQGSDSCDYCSAGFYMDEDFHSCLPCPPGYFSGDRATECTICPPGSFSLEGATECQFCAAGFYLDPDCPGMCSPCPAGTYSCERATECTPCPPGGFSSPGSATCEFCYAGYFMSMDEDAPCGCEPCPAGYYSCDRAEHCDPCPDGTWSTAGSDSCFTCYAGYYLDMDCGMCEICPPNTYSADHAFECTPCPEGSYSGSGATFCVYCIAGYYFNSNTQACELCPAGTFSNDRATECTACPPGAYSFPGSDTCLFCTAGYYLDTFTMMCLPCPAGTTSCDRATHCDACPYGSWSYPGSSVCTFCDAGYYFDINTDSCLPCAAGTFSNDRATVCTPCPAGFYSLPGSSSCYSCTAGFFLDVTSGACVVCPAGTTSGDRALFCTEIPTPPIFEETFCLAGFFLDAATNTCLPCPPNTYSADRALVCIPCPTGSYSTVGSSSCIFCTAGYYLDATLNICVPCPPNTFSADRATQCIPCPWGFTSPGGSTSCTACPAPLVYNPNSGACEACAYDEFYLGGICIPCDLQVPESCLVCPPGTEPTLVCEECCPGYYSPNGYSCEPCPDGTYSGSGFSYCVTCPPYTHWDYHKLYCVPDDSTCTSDGGM